MAEVTRPRAACSVDALRPGEVRAILLDGTPIALVRDLAGGYHALRDVCPHQGARLSGGAVEPRLTGCRAGDYRVVAGQSVLRCGWHGYEFDPETGRSLVDPDAVRVKRYPTLTRDGEVLVEI